ncbi:MAG: precorrin-2 C(20)-methyltransferase [Methanophagales archaeon]|jgi:precorrin-2/cobalt-factor-2 C20-methyltransferase|nr:precorrin-2 C(20)-methyltransferase [Methanophagales archaeon]
MKLYGIGVGPGDPELLTLKAYKILKGVDMIIAPRSSEDKRSRALHTVEEVIKERDCIVVEPVFPMTKDQDKLEQYWKKAREEVLAKGNGCGTAAFITLGDPSMYSTFYRFLDVFNDLVEELEVIPGVTSFSACTSTAQVPLVEGTEIVSIIPDVKAKKAMQVIESSDSLIFLKPKDLDKIEDMLGNEKAILCVKVGFDDQELISGKVSEIEEPTHYLSTLIVKKSMDTKPKPEPRDYTRLTQKGELRDTNGKWLYKDLTQEIIGAAMEVHRKLGSGFLEYVYEEALSYELNLKKVHFERQKELDIYYKDLLIPRKYKPDLMVDSKVIVEIKATSGLTEIEEAQLLNYLKATKMRVGLLLNFATKSLEVKRRIL